MKTTYRKDFNTFKNEVVDYSISVNEKFALHNTTMFVLYGIGLGIIDIEYKLFSTLTCYMIAGVSFLIFVLSKYWFSNHKKGILLFYNVYLFLFLMGLTMINLWHPSNVANTLVICSIVTTAMTNMFPMHYGTILLFSRALDIAIHFICIPQDDIVEIVGYVLNDFLLIIFAIGINLLFSQMKFKEFKQKSFLQNESNHDPLTKIYNRRYVERYVDVHMDGIDEWAMLLIDLDNFKSVNDKLGHEIGDELLCRVSNILRNQFRRTDCVARMGGDEFLVLMPRMTDRNSLIEKVSHILEHFPICLEDAEKKQSIQVSVSIGVAFSVLGKIDDYEKMYRKADQYMYKAKEKGKGIAVMEGIKGKKEIVIRR